MLQLFKIEWLKIKTYRTFWILFLGFIISFPLAFYFMANKYMETFSNKGTSMEAEMMSKFLDSPFIFPKVWQAAGWMGGMFFILIGMLFVLLITNEVQFRTHRQNIIDGWSRMDFLKAKLSIMVFFILVSTLLVFLSGLLVGITFSTKSSNNIFSGVYNVAYFTLMATLYLMVAFLVGFLVKRTGLAIIIYFALVCIIDNVLWLICTFKGSQIGYFLPLEVVDSLLPNPFKPKLMEKRTVADISLVITAFLYIAAYFFIIISYFKKTDLKT